jgi:ArsR family transcriptional regulator, virulence genes transcriptional regulator
MRKSTRPQLSNDKLRVSSSNLRALAHPLRLEIMTIIDHHDSASVQEIFNDLKLEQSLISQHLKILRAAKLVKSARRGKFVYYSIEYQNVRFTMQAIHAFMTAEGTTATT